MSSLMVLIITLLYLLINFVTLGSARPSTLPKNNLQVRDTTSVRYYGINWHPKAPISRFESTLVIPDISPVMTPDTLAIWPGMQPDPISALFQNSIITERWGTSLWYLDPFWCCDFGPRGGHFTNLTTIMPGDTMKSIFSWNPYTKDWTDNWIITRGEQGNADAKLPDNGGIVIDGSYSPGYVKAGSQPFVEAKLIIEEQNSAVWDFGPATWTNIIIEAQTNNTLWCAKAFWKVDSPENNSTFIWNSTEPVAMINGGSSTCYIGRIDFLAPH